MSDRLWVATRKGLFDLRLRQGRWQVEKLHFVASPASIVLPQPQQRRVYAALNLGHFGVKLHRSDDDGQSWTEVGVPTYPKLEDGTGDSLMQIWAFEAADPQQPDKLWAGTIPGGLFSSTDAGATWTINSSLWDCPERKGWFGGGADKPGIHSVCVDPRNPQHVLLAVSCGGVWRTEDAGTTWSLAAKGMFAEYMPPEKQSDENIQDPHRMVRCPSAPDCLWVQHHNGVFRTVNNAREWTHVTGLQPSSFGFAVAVHPQHPDTAWFIPAVKDETRIPVDGKLSVTRTRDGGQTCEVLTHGLPQEHCYDLVFRHSLDIDATGNQLAFGSTTGNLWTTANGGDVWTALPNHLPPIYAVRFG